ncbi:metallophosphoesterase, partial [bacterium]|nr:metallophosphoesterase [bacterium]
MGFKIAQISDIHCGDGRFDGKLLDYFIDHINSFKPDVAIIAGDLTAAGYLDEFKEAQKYIKKIECSKKIVLAGNHDCQNVGYEHFEKIFGLRYSTMIFPKNRIKGLSQSVRIMAVDSNKPDVAEGEVGRSKYKYMDKFFKGKSKDFKIFVLHHHLVSIPKTGRERNIVYDAGDILAKIDELGVNIVLSGHKHVPHCWNLDGVKLISSGTAGTGRVRGSVP